MLSIRVATILGLAASAVFAIPAPISPDLALEKRTVTALTTAQVNAFTPYTQFARAAYCNNGAATWSCGAACSANSDFVIYAGGGDGKATPAWFVGYSPSLASVVVGHEGTDPSSLTSLLNDAQALQTQLNQNYFVGAPTNIWVHQGFHSTFLRSADAVLSNVKKVMSAKSTNKVTLIGHSLGGAIASLDLLFLHFQIPSATLKMVGYGVPRVGSVEYATYMDQFDITRINNQIDPVPIVPGRGLGYAHPDTEVHIGNDNVWRSCSGHDNTDGNCSTGAVANILVGDVDDHSGPYNGVSLGTDHC